MQCAMCDFLKFEFTLTINACFSQEQQYAACPLLGFCLPSARRGAFLLVIDGLRTQRGIVRQSAIEVPLDTRKLEAGFQFFCSKQQERRFAPGLVVVLFHFRYSSRSQDAQPRNSKATEALICGRPFGSLWFRPGVHCHTPLTDGSIYCRHCGVRRADG